MCFVHALLQQNSDCGGRKLSRKEEVHALKAPLTMAAAHCVYSLRRIERFNVAKCAFFGGASSSCSAGGRLPSVHFYGYVHLLKRTRARSMEIVG